MAVAQSIFRLNHLPLWSREVEVWGNRVTATTLDRLVNLYLHHLGVRGQEEKRFLERHVRPGMQVFDIGANQGIYTMLMAQLVGRRGSVQAFEPDATLFASLRKNCEGNDAGNVRLHNIALGREPGTLKFYRCQLNSGDNRLARSHHPGWFDEVQVPVAPLDALLPGAPVDFIKIDVQGWEYQVFLGMEGILRANPNVEIYLEYWPLGLQNAGCKPPDCLLHLISLGFNLYVTAGPGLKPLTDMEALTRDLPGQKCANLLAARGTPRE